MFWFYLTKSTIIPVGVQEDTNYPFNPNCSRSGQGCTAWVIYNENLDYLHCDDLSWDGKKKCD
jgi:hypothetical protein